MKETEILAGLFCINCRDDTPHKVVYLNQSISNITCTECGKSINMKIDISHELYDEMYSRIKTKPSRMTEEYRKDLGEFLISLPRRVTSKPFRLIKEAKEVKSYLKKYKNEEQD